MPGLIVETPSKGDAINAPIGADPRTAASVRTPFQSVGNRLKFLENFYDAVLSTFAFVANTIWTVPNGNTLQIKQASGSANLDLTLIKTVFNRGVRGRMFTTGQYGDATRKPLVLDDPASPLLFDPTLYNALIITNLTHTLFVQLDPSAPVVASDGDWFTVVNQNASFFVQVKQTNGSTDIGTNLRSAATGFRSASYVYGVIPGSFGGAFQWYQEHAVPFTAS
jgi:hypothetical protein